MDKRYILRNALTLNVTKAKFDVVAEPIGLVEIKKHKAHFGFDFCQIKTTRPFYLQSL